MYSSLLCYSMACITHFESLCFSSQVRERLKEEVKGMRMTRPNFQPGLVVLQVSGDKLLV